MNARRAFTGAGPAACPCVCRGRSCETAVRAALVHALLLVLSALAQVPAAGQSIRGLVTDAETAQPIGLATVNLVAASGERVASALTTDEGFFALQVPDGGRYLVRATALGFTPVRIGPVEVEDDGVLVVEVPMSLAPVDIEGVVVQGERQGDVGNYLARKGFWERYEKGRGAFLAPGDVLASDAMFTPHLLRQLDIVVPQHGVAPWAVWPLLGITETGGCEPRVWVDDVWINREGFGIRETVGLDDYVPIDRVLAVEVFHGPFQAPLRYQGTTSSEMGNACGVILIWTK